jgi:hypothetical protein
VSGEDLPREWREVIANTCFWLADNYYVWQPFALLAAVGLLLFSLSVLVIFWESLS